MQNTVQFRCPPELLVGLHLDVDQFTQYVQLQAALALFKSGQISSGLAAKWLKIPRSAFLVKAFESGAVLLEDNADDFHRETGVL